MHRAATTKTRRARWVELHPRIGDGRRNIAITANTYSHVMLDEGEVDYAGLLT